MSYNWTNRDEHQGRDVETGPAMAGDSGGGFLFTIFVLAVLGA